jgi:ornithine carbamoyltransferase
MKRDLINLQDFSSDEIAELLELTQKMKNNPSAYNQALKGKTVGLIFQKPSNRTRVSFEVGVWELGGYCVYLGPEEINLGVRESTSDVSKTLSRYLDAIVARTHRHQDIIDLAKSATIPVINGLSDLFHPCQALADLFSIKEKFQELKGLTLAYIGDGNNVCLSLLLGCSKMGINIHVATPKGYEPQNDVVEAAAGYAEESGSILSVSHNAQKAAQNSNIIYTDTWVSMGQEAESKQRLHDFKNYQINNELVRLANPDFIFMHCLPAHRGQEVTEEVIDGGHSIVFDQAENRLHIQKAILLELLKSS